MSAFEFDPTQYGTGLLSGGSLNVAQAASGSDGSGTTTISTADGDTLTISDEAYSLFKTKMAEYGAESTEALTTDQLSDLAQSMSAAVAAEDTVAASSESESETGASSGESGAGAATGGSGEASGSDQDRIDELEQLIAELQDEIAALQSKAQEDPEAKEDLKTKQVELLAYENELTQLMQGM